ncbi:hypothetical protein KR215_009173, partial [Drosophila sulfurigaster]
TYNQLTFAAKDIQKCHFGASKCLVDSMNYVIKHYSKGLPQIGLNPIDVVDIGDMNLVRTRENGGLWVVVNITNALNHGFENTTITKVEGFDKDPTKKYLTIWGRIPRLIHKGHFTARGHISVIPINLSGDSASEFQNLKFKLKLKGIIEFRNNKRYLKLYQIHPIVKIDRWIVRMEDLFKENTDLTIIVNKLFNERWLEIWNEWEPAVLESFSKVFLSLVQDTFNKISYDDMFLP